MAARAWQIGGVMPIYDFWCKKCKEFFEAIVPLKKYDEEVKCPKCGEPLKRLVSPVLFKI